MGWEKPFGASVVVVPYPPKVDSVGVVFVVIVVFLKFLNFDFSFQTDLRAPLEQAVSSVDLLQLQPLGILQVIYT